MFRGDSTVHPEEGGQTAVLQMLENSNSKFLPAIMAEAAGSW